jgi:hypothetical protein
VLHTETLMINDRKNLPILPAFLHKPTEKEPEYQPVQCRLQNGHPELDSQQGQDTLSYRVQTNSTEEWWAVVQTDIHNA